MKLQNQQQKTLLSFFYPLIKTKKIKKIFNKIKEKRAQSTLIYKFQSSNNESLSNIIIKKKSTKLFKNFLLSDFYKKINKIINIINIKINPNNTMISLTDYQGNIKYKLSAGMLKLNSSKKNYKVIYNLVLTEFFKKLKTKKITKNILVKLNLPKSLRKRVTKRLKFYIRDSNVFEGLRQLPFNGCRPPKVRRKKRKGFKITKPTI